MTYYFADFEDLVRSEAEEPNTVLDAEILGILWGHVDMTLGDDDAFFEVDFAGWALKGALAGTSDIAGFANRGG